MNSLIFEGCQIKIIVKGKGVGEKELTTYF